jgi:precorrin-8X/cobalt-precorrin-8 methylmutase
MQQLTARGRAIEEGSFGVIDAEAGPHHFSPSEWQVVRRVIHATADFEFQGITTFHQQAVTAGIAALRRGAPIVADVQMIEAGLNRDRLAVFGCSSHNFISDSEVIAEAKSRGETRAVIAMRRARALLDGGIAAIGNAPTALLEIGRMVREEGIRPALVIGVPVGFVNAAESKEAMLGLPVPAIVTRGRKGGSPIAVAIVHALLMLAEANTESSAPVLIPHDTVEKSLQSPFDKGGKREARGDLEPQPNHAPFSNILSHAGAGTVMIVGIGNDGLQGLSRRALEEIWRADLLCGGERHLRFFPAHPAEKHVIRSNLSDLATLLASARHRRAVVLASGDPGFYGVARFLIKALGKERVSILPAPSAMQEAFARIKEPWDDALLLSVHGRSMQGLVETISGHDKVALFTDPTNAPPAIAQALLAADINDYVAYVCENLGAPDECVRVFDLTTLAETTDIAPLNTLILLREGRV